MKITANKVGIVHYTLKNGDGKTLDTSEGKPPLEYIHGKGNLIPGMENSLEGKEKGSKFQIVIEPKDAYGDKSDAMINEVPLSNFPEKDQVKAGVMFQSQTPQGIKVGTVIKIENETVTLDFNHPLAGETLHFQVEVVDVRDATEDELSHGHIHGEGCNH